MTLRDVEACLLGMGEGPGVGVVCYPMRCCDVRCEYRQSNTSGQEGD